MKGRHMGANKDLKGLQARFAADDRLIGASPAILAFLDQDPGPRGGRIPRLRDDHDGDALHDLWRQARSGGQARADVTIRVQGEPARIMEVSLRQVDQSMQPGELFLEMRDVTGARASARRQFESERLHLLGQLASRVAHEINNPLAGLKNAALLMRRLGHDAAARERYADVIDREVANIALVVRHLYETLHWVDGSTHVCSMPDAVGAALHTLRNSRDDVTVDVEIDPAARRVATPEAVARLVVYTILRNALNASPGGGVVRVRGHRDMGHLVLEVEDQGTGIPAAQRESLLHDAAGPATGTARRSDLIFGLPYAREVLETFGGSITIGDAACGAGAVFTTRWPLAHWAGDTHGNDEGPRSAG